MGQDKKSIQPQIPLGEGLEGIGGELPLTAQVVDAGEGQGAVQQQCALGVPITFIGKAPPQALQHGFHGGFPRSAPPAESGAGSDS